MGDGLVLKGADYDTEIRPVQRRPLNGEMYTTEYAYDVVHMDFEPDKVFPEQCETAMLGSALLYRYPQKPAIKVTREKVLWAGAGGRESAMKQAYHCLSILDSAGYVSGWRQK